MTEAAVKLALPDVEHDGLRGLEGTFTVVRQEWALLRAANQILADIVSEEYEAKRDGERFRLARYHRNALTNTVRTYTPLNRTRTLALNLDALLRQYEGFKSKALAYYLGLDTDLDKEQHD